MTRIVAMILALALLSACGDTGNDGSNPLDEEEEETDGGTDGGDGGTDGGEGDGTDTPIESDGSLPPGTQQPSPETSIVRYEPLDEENGGGYARNIQYDSASDTFSVDNLAFDGDNVYTRGGQASSQNAVGQLGPFAVYEADASSVDPVTGNVVPNLTYRAIYGVSNTGQTEFAIVRTGSYIDYGFGGFVYQRNSTDANGNPVTLDLPTEGDAAYAGDYAGVRIFEGGAGLEYVTGDASMQIDFKDFNDSQSGVQLFIRNRRLFDIDGNDITDEYVAALQDQNDGYIVQRDGNNQPVLPNISPEIAPGVADANGEIVQNVFTTLTLDDGSSQQGATGQYYAIVSGQNAEEIVGVLVMEGDDPRRDATFQETGGFIVYRQ